MVSMLEPVIILFSSNPWGMGSVVIIITFTVASLLTWLLFKVLRRIAGATRFKLDDHTVMLLRPPVYYTLLRS